ncbi:DUF1844 domain-containing protein [Candidatus Woesearchaeota archaeon]|nr:DUF1844 domain-containing protein [Candidatus Woesearchaeota archaeon]
MEEKRQDFSQHFIQLVIGLQSTAWMAMGKQMNPQTGKQEVNLDLARDSIDTLLMLREKTKGNLTETEKGILENAMQDLELNFIETSKKEGKPKVKKQTEEKDSKRYEAEKKKTGKQ